MFACPKYLFFVYLNNVCAAETYFFLLVVLFFTFSFIFTPKINFCNSFFLFTLISVLVLFLLLFFTIITTDWLVFAFYSLSTLQGKFVYLMGKFLDFYSCPSSTVVLYILYTNNMRAFI